MDTRGGMLRRVRTSAQYSTCQAPPLESRHTPPTGRETHDQHAVVVDRKAQYRHTASVVCEAAKGVGGKGLSNSEHMSELDAEDEYGVTRLFEAVMDNDLARVRCLLQASASPNIPDSAGYSPLLVAVRGRRLRIAQTLVEAGAGECGWRKLLPYAVRTQALPLVQLVLRAGCDYTLPEAPSESTRPLVEAAVRERWLAVLMCLHPRLGTTPECGIRVLPHELLQQVCVKFLRPQWLPADAPAAD